MYQHVPHGKNVYLLKKAVKSETHGTLFIPVSLNSYKESGRQHDVVFGRLIYKSSQKLLDVHVGIHEVTKKKKMKNITNNSSIWYM